MQAMAAPLRHLYSCRHGFVNHYSSHVGFSEMKKLLRQNRLVVRMRQEGDRDDSGFSGEESPESLFMKELKRRGLAKPSSSTDTKTKEDEMGNSGSSSSRSKSSNSTSSTSSSSSSSSSWAETKRQRNQLELSRALNSEGLEGLIPRVTELLKLGATSFLAFWPFVLTILAVFVAMYLYFGPSFVHSGEVHSSGRPPYIDPYQLLEEEGITTESF